MNIQDVVSNLIESGLKGYQITKHNGILTSTWLIYKEGEKYYYFDINQEIEFVSEFCYSTDELFSEFIDSNYTIDDIIN